MLHLARRIADAGADIISTTAPLAFCSSQEDIVRHFELLTDSVRVPWMVYGNAFSYPEIEPQTFRRLAQMDGIAAVKDTRPDMRGALSNLLALENEPAAYLSGGEYLIGPMFLLGAAGNVSGLTSLYPKVFVELYTCAKNGDAVGVARLSKEIAVMHGAISDAGFWLAAFKAIGARLGYMRPFCAQPCPPLTDQTALRQVGVLSERFSAWE